jgi:hypothetical protein
MPGLPKIQNAQYGDSAKLEQLGAVRLTDNPAADVQDMKSMEGGRPAEMDPVKLATRQMQQSGKKGELSPEKVRYQKMFNSLAVQHGAINKWVKLANSPSAGPLTRAYARAALRTYDRNVRKTTRDTPFFED